MRQRAQLPPRDSSPERGRTKIATPRAGDDNGLITEMEALRAEMRKLKRAVSQSPAPPREKSNEANERPFFNKL